MDEEKSQKRLSLRDILAWLAFAAAIGIVVAAVVTLSTAITLLVREMLPGFVPIPFTEEFNKEDALSMFETDDGFGNTDVAVAEVKNGELEVKLAPVSELSSSVYTIETRLKKPIRIVPYVLEMRMKLSCAFTSVSITGDMHYDSKLEINFNCSRSSQNTQTNNGSPRIFVKINIRDANRQMIGWKVVDSEDSIAEPSHWEQDQSRHVRIPHLDWLTVRIEKDQLLRYKVGIFDSTKMQVTQTTWIEGAFQAEQKDYLRMTIYPQTFHLLDVDYIKIYKP